MNPSLVWPFRNESSKRLNSRPQIHPKNNDWTIFKSQHVHYRGNETTYNTLRKNDLEQDQNSVGMWSFCYRSDAYEKCLIVVYSERELSLKWVLMDSLARMWLEIGCPIGDLRVEKLRYWLVLLSDVRHLGFRRSNIIFSFMSSIEVGTHCILHT